MSSEAAFGPDHVAKHVSTKALRRLVMLVKPCGNGGGGGGRAPEVLL